MSSQKIIIVGVGNLLRHDDGIGPVIINKFRRRGAVLAPNEASRAQNDFLKNNIDFFDAKTDPLILIDAIERYKTAIIIDAVDMQEAPGTIKVFSPDEAKIKIKSDVLSTHGFGLAEVIHLIYLLEIPTEIKIVGIQPEDISIGEGLSEVVKNIVPEIITIINEIITKQIKY